MTVGPVVDGALDPAIDHAAEKFKEAGDHVVDHAADVMGKKLTEALNQMDAIAGKRIDQLDQIMGKRIDQLNVIAETSLASLNTMIKQALLQESQIINAALDREENIINNTLSHLDTTLDRTTGRLEATESDAMDRMETAIQDSVPVTAEGVTRQLEWAVFFVLLAAITLTMLGRSILQHLGSEEKRTIKKHDRVRSIAKDIGKDFAFVALPIAVAAAVIQLVYVGYYHHADSKRIATRAGGAEDLEHRGQFAEAAIVWRRLQPLASSNADRDRYSYGYQRDRFLSAFAARNANPHDVTLAGDLFSLTATNQGKVDGELQAIKLYFLEKQARQGTLNPGLRHDIDTYLDTFVSKRKTVPYWGKLAYMAAIRIDLDDVGTASALARVSKGLVVCEEMLKNYPTYAAGHLLRAELLALQSDAETNRPESSDPGTQAKIAEDLQVLSEQDPALGRLAHLATYDLSVDTTAALQKMRCVGMSSGSGAGSDGALGCAPADPKAAEPPIDVNLVAEYEKTRREAVEKLSSPGTQDAGEAQLETLRVDKFAKYDVVHQSADQLLQRDFAAYKEIAQLAYGSPQVSLLIANEQFDLVIRRNQGLADLQVIEDRYREAKAKSDSSMEIHLAATVAQRAADIGEYLIADEWYARAVSPRKASASKADQDLIAELEKRHFASVTVSPALAYVFE